MAVESATYISQLNPSNPAGTDFVEEGDDHITLIKQVLQNQFPSLGANVVSATAAQINNTVGSTSNLQDQIDSISHSYGGMNSSQSGDDITIPANNVWVKFVQSGASSYSDSGVSVTPSAGTLTILKSNPDFVRLNLVLTLRLNSTFTIGDGTPLRVKVVRESNNSSVSGSAMIGECPRNQNDGTLLVVNCIDPNPASVGEVYHFELNTDYTSSLSLSISSVNFWAEVIGG